MLLFQLLPFFLATRVNQNDTWKYGPEYTFDGHIKMITSLEQDQGKPLGTGVQLKLKCIPREPDILGCRMEDTRIIRLKPLAFDIHRAEPDLNDTYRPLNLIRSPFQIKFNERGIESYSLQETHPPEPNWTINMAKLVANQLSFGIDLSDEMSLNFVRVLENFTTGECETNFQVTRKPIKEDSKENQQFELVPLPMLGKFAEESIQVEKRRNIGDCLRCVEPFFGTRYTLGLVLRDVLTKLKSSESRIFISKHKFISETINESDLYDQDRNKLGSVLDHIKLTLESVRPAQHELPKFTKPVITGVLPLMEPKNV